jgi:pilus assembly protein CpaC
MKTLQIYLRIKSLLLTALVLLPTLVLVAMPVCANEHIQNFQMIVGDIKVIKVLDVERVAVGDDKLVQYKPLENGELVLIAALPGSTTVYIWQKGNRQVRYNIQVIQKSIVSEIDFARELVAIFPAIKVSIRKNRLIFNGYINKEDLDNFNRVISAFPDSISTVRTRQFSVEKIVRLDVRLVEISKRASSQIGIRWQDSIGGPTFGIHKELYSNGTAPAVNGPANSNTPENFINSVPVGDKSFYGYGGVTSLLTSRIELLASTGNARIIASPKLTAKSGSKARFRSGGQFPITTTDEFGRSEVDFKDYGITLEIEPTVDENNVINTSVFTEVSAIDPGVSVQGVPGISTRNTNTTVNLENGDTLALSGLGYYSDGENIAKVPFFGSLPLVGGLFRTKAKDHSETELVILITPHIVTVDSEKNKTLTSYSQQQLDRVKEKNIDSYLLD